MDAARTNAARMKCPSRFMRDLPRIATRTAAGPELSIVRTKSATHLQAGESSEVRPHITGTTANKSRMDGWRRRTVTPAPVMRACTLSYASTTCLLAPQAAGGLCSLSKRLRVRRPYGRRPGRSGLVRRPVRRSSSARAVLDRTSCRRADAATAARCAAIG